MRFNGKVLCAVYCIESGARSNYGRLQITLHASSFTECNKIKLNLKKLSN